MDQVVIQAAGTLLAAAISAVIGYFYRKSKEGAVSVIPGKSKESKRRYEHLKGKWYLYYVTRLHPSQKPQWVPGTQEIKVDADNNVKGKTRIEKHPLGELHYEAVGEIRGGRMIINDNSLRDETEFASFTFHDLRPPECLIGIWTGLDNQRHLIAAPAILSRKPLSKSELNEIKRRQPLYLASSEEDYELFEKCQSSLLRVSLGLVDPLRRRVSATNRLLLSFDGAAG